MENLVQHGVGHCGLRERVTMLSVAGVTRLSSDAYDWQRKKGRRVIPHSAPTDQHAHVGIPSNLRVSEYPFPTGSGVRESLSLQVILHISLHMSR